MTFVYYLADDDDNNELGTKVYDKNKKHVVTSKYKPNSVFIFAPSDDDKIKTWHNMELKKDNYERKSIQSWFLYDKYKRNPLPFEGYKWRTDEKHLRERRKRYKLYKNYFSKLE